MTTQRSLAPLHALHEQCADTRVAAFSFRIPRQSGDLTRLAELLWTIARSNADAGSPAPSDALLTSRFYVRRRSEGDERLRPDIRATLSHSRHPAWESTAVSAIVTPPRATPTDASDAFRVDLSPISSPRRKRSLSAGGPCRVVVPQAGAAKAAAAACPAGPVLVGPWMAPPPAKRKFGGRVQGAAARSLRMVRATDFAGLTALHHAARLNRADMVKLLLEFGADHTVRGSV